MLPALCVLNSTIELRQHFRERVSDMLGAVGVAAQRQVPSAQRDVLADHLERRVRLPGGLPQAGRVQFEIHVVADQAAQDEAAHAHFLGTEQLADAGHTSEALADRSWSWVVVDHYALDVRWETAVRSAARGLLVIDDLADRPHDCDLLLDQNYYADKDARYVGLVPDRCELLLGPRYALLREEFLAARLGVRTRTGPATRLLVCFGGMDADNFTARALDALADDWARAVTVNPVTNRVYFANYDWGSLGVIDGASNSVITTVAVESDTGTTSSTRVPIPT